MARVLRCAEADYDAQTGQCAAPVWEDDAGLLPPLSGAEGLQIAAAIGAVWALGFGVRQLRKLLERA